MDIKTCRTVGGIDLFRGSLNDVPIGRYMANQFILNNSDKVAAQCRLKQNLPNNPAQKIGHITQNVAYDTLFILSN